MNFQALAEEGLGGSSCSVGGDLPGEFVRDMAIQDVRSFVLRKTNEILTI
jgi:hypothetical protein